jgi:hypothetical protein
VIRCDAMRREATPVYDVRAAHCHGFMHLYLYEGIHVFISAPWFTPSSTDKRRANEGRDVEEDTRTLGVHRGSYRHETRLAVQPLCTVTNPKHNRTARAATVYSPSAKTTLHDPIAISATVKKTKRIPKSRLGCTAKREKQEIGKNAKRLNGRSWRSRNEFEDEEGVSELAVSVR